MSVSATFTGNGSIGEIEPGWTVTEDATPVSPADATAGTGDVTFSAESDVDSEFLIGNAAVFTHDRLGSVSGKVDSFSGSGNIDSLGSTVHIGLATNLSRLNVTRSAIPLGEGLAVSAWGGA